MHPPKCYIMVNGIMKKNPVYEKWKATQGGAISARATTVAEPEIALPVLSNIDDHIRFIEDIGQEVPLSESTVATIEMMQEPALSFQAGMLPDDMVDQLGEVFAKHEVPMGLMNKLLTLSEYKRLEFIIDDSLSMLCLSNTLDPVTKQPQTRWKEAHSRMKEMLEILAYVPFKHIDILFFIRQDHATFTRQGRDPKIFLADAFRQIDNFFSVIPAGMTSALERVRESIQRGSGDSVARYFVSDGTVFGGAHAQEQLIKLLMNRPNPQGNPITFISCTNEGSQADWMKNAEEVIPFCSECDDFQDESQEVLKDQGAALPYTKGFHLICQLCAAINPDDLDAMDESVPLTKATLDNLLGLQLNEESYRHYFSNFVEAQRKYAIAGPSDQVKKCTRWNIDKFIHTPTANRIPQVQQFKQKLRQISLPPNSTSIIENEGDMALVKEMLLSRIPLERTIQLLKGRVEEQEIRSIARLIFIERAMQDDDYSDGRSTPYNQGGMSLTDLGRSLLTANASAGDDRDFMHGFISYLSEETPEELKDPIMHTLMEEPVVLSSGFVVDRDTILNEDGTMKFSLCPWTRQKLKSEVYPMVCRKKKLIEFKLGKVQSLLDTASKLVGHGKIVEFIHIQAMAKQFIDGLGVGTYGQQERRLIELNLAAWRKADAIHSNLWSPSMLADDLVRIYKRTPELGSGRRDGEEGENEITKEKEREFRDLVSALVEHARMALSKKQLDHARSWCDACEIVNRECGSLAKLPTWCISDGVDDYDDDDFFI